MAALLPEISVVEKAAPSVVLALTKFMFLRVIFDALEISAPLVVVEEILPPLPTVVPVPLIVNEPVVLAMVNPLAAPLADRLVSTTLSACFEPTLMPLKAAPIALVAAIVPFVQVNVPLLAVELKACTPASGLIAKEPKVVVGLLELI